MKLKTGSGAYIFDRRRPGEPPHLNGHRVFYNRHMSEPASGAKSILAGDFSYYKLSEFGPLEIRILTQKFAGTDQVGLLGQQLLDGALAKFADDSVSPVKALQH
jgi:HK97 family phage major capsid protein